jgi:hypothetical protein
MNNLHNLFSCILQGGFECAMQISIDVFRNVYNLIAVCGRQVDEPAVQLIWREFREELSNY